MPTPSERTRIASEEAAEWYIRSFDERNMRRSDRKKFLQWLKSSPENVAEILRISGMDKEFKQRKLSDRSGDLQKSNIVDLARAIGAAKYASEFRSTASDEPERKPARPLMAVAAMLTAFTVSLILGFAFYYRTPEGTVVTAASQWQHITLEDGSSVHMDARTRIKVEFSAEKRIVHVLDGQSVFDVTKDPHRPFVARTKAVDVIAIGTRFGVAVDPDNGVTTTVQEGVVKVTPRGEPDHASGVTLQAGQALKLFAGSLAAPAQGEVAKVDAERDLGWATGWLTFGGGERIGDAVAQFNRRNVQQIEIVDTGIAERGLVGYYRIRVESPDSFAKLLDGQEGIVVTKDRSRNVLRLTLE
jgi:transmembrane sensor